MSNDAEPKVKNPIIPPFFIEPIKHWNNQVIIIKQAAPSMRSKRNKIWIRISVQTEVEYHKIQNYRRGKGSIIKFLIWIWKNLIFVLRGLLANKNIAVSQKALEIEELNNLTITRMYRQNTKNRFPLSLFLIQMPRQQTKSNALFKMTEIMVLVVHFEKYRGYKFPIQCHNCQGCFTQRQSVIFNLYVLNVLESTRMTAVLNIMKTHAKTRTV